MMQTVVPAIRSGGCNLVYVMPNLIPPLTDPQDVVKYRCKLERIEPNVTFMMSLYLSAETTIETIKKAAAAGISGVKYYPRGVTTNSDAGVSEIEQFYSVLAEMQKLGLMLNLHGEAAPASGVTVLNAEREFLPVLEKIHENFPQLKIVLEHCTSREAVESVLRCGDTVAATITVHHLFMTIDSWAGSPLNFCKPVAKTPEDREALLEAATSGNPKFFLGTDSAPHPASAKRRVSKAAAGCFTQPYALQLLAKAFDARKSLDKLEDFCSNFGRDFYGIARETSSFVELERDDTATVEDTWTSAEQSSESVIPFMAGERLGWKVTWLPRNHCSTDYTI